MVRGSHYDIGVGVDGAYVVRGPGDAGSRVPAGRFQQNLFGFQFGELLLHKVGVEGVGDNDDILGRYDFLNRSNVCWSSERPVPKKSRNCLGSVLRLNGQKRLPIPPPMMTQKLSLFIAMIVVAFKVSAKVHYIL